MAVVCKSSFSEFVSTYSMKVTDSGRESSTENHPPPLFRPSIGQLVNGYFTHFYETFRGVSASFRTHQVNLSQGILFI